MDLGNAPEHARHSESSGTDAGRQRVLGRDAGICTTWNFAALFRGDTPADVIELLIKELLRVIRSGSAARFGMSVDREIEVFAEPKRKPHQNDSARARRERKLMAGVAESIVSLDHRGTGTTLAPALLACFRLPAGFAAEFVDRETRLLAGPVRVLVTESTGEDNPVDEKEPWAVPVELPFSPSGLPAC
jgi:hypothetical protein